MVKMKKQWKLWLQWKTDRNLLHLPVFVSESSGAGEDLWMLSLALYDLCCDIIKRLIHRIVNVYFTCHSIDC